MTTPVIASDAAVIDGTRVAWRHAPWSGAVPAVYVHGVPTYSFDWDPFLVRVGGLALDLPGFGASEKAPSREQSLTAISRVTEAFVDHHGVEQVDLVIHDWGGAAFDFALRCPHRVRRLLIFNTPFGIEGWRWHWIARIWRRRVLGEAFQAASTKFAVTQLMRVGRHRGRTMPREWRDAQWALYDRATRAAILRLYRSASNEDLEAYARQVAPRFAGLTAETLILWGDRDPYVPSRFADAYVAQLPDARCVHVDAAHWPWVDDQQVLERACAFLRDGTRPA